MKTKFYAFFLLSICVSSSYAMMDSDIYTTVDDSDSESEYSHVPSFNAVLDNISDDLEELNAAVKAGNLNTVERCVKQNRSLLNSRDREGCTPLLHAATYGSVAITQFLVANGASIHATNRQGRTPVQLAEWNFSDEKEGEGRATYDFLHKMYTQYISSSTAFGSGSAEPSRKRSRKKGKIQNFSTKR